MFGFSCMTNSSGEVTFSVYRTSSQLTTGGRVLKGESDYVGDICGVLAQSKSSEKERWRQLSHPVSHLVIVKGIPPISLQVGDVLRYQGRDFTLCAVPYDVGGLGHWTELCCDERRDLK